jgi:hypothetical protein
VFPHPSRQIGASVCLKARYLIGEDIHSFILAELEFAIYAQHFAIKSYNSTAKLPVARCHVGDGPRTGSITFHVLDKPSEDRVGTLRTIIHFNSQPNPHRGYMPGGRLRAIAKPGGRD